MTFIISFTVTALTERIIIPILKEKAAQPIYEGGPHWHLSKAGTPTFGGIAFIISSLISVTALAPIMLIRGSAESFFSLLLSTAFAVANALIGIIDDAKKLKNRKNQGLTPTQKLILQFIMAGIFLALRIILFNDDTEIPFFGNQLNLGFFYYPISLLVLVGLVNFANLTDGIDGLASSVGFSIGIALLFICSALIAEGAIAGAVIIGTTLGFLIFNLHPAKIFMGDTGSLFLGAFVAAAGYMIEDPIVILLISVVYLIEGTSVILQVLIYKLTKKRLFKMAPLHHHLEKCGWSENRICIVAMLITFLFGVTAYAIFMP
jgi:phospho-N-acetylmuramoyl-pentapeptide-transferase